MLAVATGAAAVLLCVCAVPHRLQNVREGVYCTLPSSFLVVVTPDLATVLTLRPSSLRLFSGSSQFLLKSLPRAVLPSCGRSLRSELDCPTAGEALIVAEGRVTGAEYVSA